VASPKAAARPRSMSLGGSRALSSAESRNLLSKLGLPTDGSKGELKERIIAAAKVTLDDGPTEFSTDIASGPALLCVGESLNLWVAVDCQPQ
jgi:hypothetical protein